GITFVIFNAITGWKEDMSNARRNSLHVEFAASVWEKRILNFILAVRLPKLILKSSEFIIAGGKYSSTVTSILLSGGSS
ncbi:hypothetical protein CEXT_361751, partial [Caerostris extrusa]